jgi:hypothetical protein
MLVALTLVTSARAIYIEQFNTLPDGWTVNNIDNTGATWAVIPTWSANGGTK